MDRARSSYAFLRTIGVLPLPRWMSWGLALSVLVSAACVVVAGRALRGWIETLNRHGELVAVIPAFAAIAATLAIASGLRIYTSTAIGERVGARLRIAIFSDITQRPLRFFETNAVGNLLSLILSDVTLVQATLRRSLSPLARNILVIAGSALVMAITNWRLTAICALTVPIPALVALAASTQRRRLALNASEQAGRLAGQVEEVFSGIYTVKTLNREAVEQQRFGEAVAEATQTAHDLALSRSILLSVVVLLGLATAGLIVWYGLNSIRQGRLTPGGFSSFLFLLVVCGGACASLSDLWSDAAEATGALQRIMSHLRARDETPPRPSPQALPPEAPSNAPKAIQFDTVDFRYSSRADELALDSVSFRLAPGETVALVGASGAGKTTVTRLLLGLDVPERGRILIDGMDIALVDDARLRGWFAVVQQDPFIFSASLADNIRYGRPDATDAEVQVAAEEAAVHLFARELPDGLATFVGERGARLSGGQRQRIAIARAILRRAPILLLDEATSALDSVTEALVHKAIMQPPAPQTTLIIAHKLATLDLADRIIVLHHGRVEATGAHDELMSYSKLYRRLVELQLRAG